MNIKLAYRLLPVHPQDQVLLGVELKRVVYVDGMLPFGLCSAPKIFTAVVDASQWVMQKRDETFVDHYRDNFVTLGPSGLEECSVNLERIVATCRDLGMPVAMEKLEGLSQCLAFLGIEVDTRKRVLCLPSEKLLRVKAMLSRWSFRRSCCRRQLESPIGTLQYVCMIVKPSRAFLHQMIDLRIPGATQGHHHVRLNRHFCVDLQWWCVFVEHWNDVDPFP